MDPGAIARPFVNESHTCQAIPSNYIIDMWIFEYLAHFSRVLKLHLLQDFKAQAADPRREELIVKPSDFLTLLHTLGPDNPDTDSRHHSPLHLHRKRIQCCFGRRGTHGDTDNLPYMGEEKSNSLYESGRRGIGGRNEGRIKEKRTGITAQATSMIVCPHLASR